jgi:lysophospholipase L1-like esterase
MKKTINYSILIILIILLNVGLFKSLDWVFFKYFESKQNNDFLEAKNSREQTYQPYVMFSPEAFRKPIKERGDVFSGTDRYGLFLSSRDDTNRYLNDKCDYRILMLGGSTVQGRGLKDIDETIPARLEVLFQKHFNSTHIKVLNAGVGGYYSGQEISRLMFYLMGKINFDHVIFFHGNNDFANIPAVPFLGVNINYHPYFMSLVSSKASINRLDVSLSYFLNALSKESPLLFYLKNSLKSIKPTHAIVSKYVSDEFATVDELKHKYSINYWVGQHFYRYRDNINIASQLLEDKATFILQPSILSKSGLSKTELNIINNFERVAKGRFYSKPYLQAKSMFWNNIKSHYIELQKTGNKSNFIDLSGIFDDKEKNITAYSDHVHYTSEGKKRLAEGIFQNSLNAIKFKTDFTLGEKCQK